jgi:hypothetical protein
MIVAIFNLFIEQFKSNQALVKILLYKIKPNKINDL